MWIQYFQQAARLSDWSENEAVALAELHMLDKAQSWFVGLDQTTLTICDALARLSALSALVTQKSPLRHASITVSRKLMRLCASCLPRLATLQKGKPPSSLVG